MANRIGRGYSYDIIRAKTLYAKQARKVGSGVRLLPSAQTLDLTKSAPETIEYGPHIPTLIDLAEGGSFDQIIEAAIYLRILPSLPSISLRSIFIY